MMDNWGYGSGGNVIMMLFWALVIVGIVIFVRYMTKYARLQPQDSALYVLKQRYAKGEIDKDEFEEKRNGIAE